MLLTQEQLLIQENARALANKVIRPFATQWAIEKIFPQEALHELGQAGFLGMLIPQSYGGSEIDYISYVTVIREIAKADGALSTIVSVHNSVAMLPILQYGNEEQKKQ